MSTRDDTSQVWKLASVRVTLFPEGTFDLGGPDLWDDALPLDGQRHSHRQHGPAPQRVEFGVDGERSFVIQALPQRLDVIVTRDKSTFLQEGIATFDEAGGAFDAALAVGAKLALRFGRTLSRIAVAVEAIREFDQPAKVLVALSEIHPGLPITADNVDAMFMRSVRRRLNVGTETNLLETWRSVHAQLMLVPGFPEIGHAISGASSTRHVLQFEVEMNTLAETTLSLPPEEAISIIRALMEHVRSAIGMPC